MAFSFICSAWDCPARCSPEPQAPRDRHDPLALMPVTFLPHALEREPFRRAGLTLSSPSLQASAERCRDHDDTETQRRIISTAKAAPYDASGWSLSESA